MNRYPLWKNLLIIFSVVLGLIYTVPNFFGESPAVQITPARTSTKVDAALLAKVEDVLKAESIDFAGIYLDERGVKARFADEDTQIKAKDALNTALGSKDYTIALNLLSETPDWLKSLGANPMYLGLDLRGGVHFLMQVDMKAAINKAAERFVGDFRTTLRKEKISYLGVTRNEDVVTVRFKNEAQLEKGRKTLGVKYPNVTFTPYINDEQQLLKASLSPVEQKQIQDFAIKQNIQTLHNRINELGVAEPIIQQQGADRVVVQLPGVQDTTKAKEILGRTATLEIRMVDEDRSDNASMEKASRGIAPIGSEVYKDRDGYPVIVKKNVVLTGDYITDAGPSVDGQSGRAAVSVTLDARGARLFQQTTRENVGKRMAILLIEKGSTEVVTAPVINEEIGGGRVQITGMANTQEATDVALLLRAGALAAPMEIIEERTVGPSMGKENISRGINSTLWGFAAIAVMMSIYYMVFGVISVIALAINLLLLVALLSMLQATLTLPGLAAIALALGMAIDANVLINERIREELRAGNTPGASIKIGYDRAFDTILDSNITTMIAGLALFLFGTGPIKGFAVVHVLGIMTSMFSAVMISRGIVNFVYGRRRKIEKLSIGQLYNPNK
jgi:preprotein translocase subunit SecD